MKVKAKTILSILAKNKTAKERSTIIDAGLSLTAHHNAMKVFDEVGITEMAGKARSFTGNYRIFRALSFPILAVLEKAGMTFEAAFQVLRVIAYQENRKTNISGLRRLGKFKHEINGHISKLESVGLVSKHRNKREAYVRLTPEGAEFLELCNEFYTAFKPYLRI